MTSIIASNRQNQSTFKALEQIRFACIRADTDDAIVVGFEFKAGESFVYVNCEPQWMDVLESQPGAERVSDVWVLCNKLNYVRVP